MGNKLSISIHALLTESDSMALSFSVEKIKFQSTLSSRRATPTNFSTLAALAFQSTLSSRRATGDCTICSLVNYDFNPRSPHGERRWLHPAPEIRKDDFNPRSPHGERQEAQYGSLLFQIISIHALLTESDLLLRPHLYQLRDFNPRSPHGERQFQLCPVTRIGKFQSTLSSRRATVPGQSVVVSHLISIHALLTESDPKECYHTRRE